VSRDTARRAVATLREEGLVVTVPQRGTYVRERPEALTDSAGSAVVDFPAFSQVSMPYTSCVVITYLDVGSRLRGNA
jgi:hypothetical protein